MSEAKGGEPLAGFEHDSLSVGSDLEVPYVVALGKRDIQAAQRTRVVQANAVNVELLIGLRVGEEHREPTAGGDLEVRDVRQLRTRSESSVQ